MSEAKTARTSPSPAANAFVGALSSLDRGRLAELRRAVGTKLGQSGSAMRVFYPLLPDPVEQPLNQNAAYLIATLYPFNQKSFTGNLGQSMRALIATGSDSIAKRMVIILESGLDWQAEGGGELPFRLRQAVKLLKSKEIGVDWAQLLDDLGRWNSPSKVVQRQWAEAFFRKQRDPSMTETEEANPHVD